MGVRSGGRVAVGVVKEGGGGLLGHAVRCFLRRRAKALAWLAWLLWAERGFGAAQMHLLRWHL